MFAQIFCSGLNRHNFLSGQLMQFLTSISFFFFLVIEKKKIKKQKMQIMGLYLTGHLDTVFSAEHSKEILRYIYNQQVH
jgi:hypothetical protein